MTKTNLNFGFIQGRLSTPPNNELQWFPDNWEIEFPVANSLGAKFIELFTEREHNTHNPVWSNSGIDSLIDNFKKNDLEIYSLCNDFIIDNNFLDKAVIDQNILLLDQAHKLGIKKIILPFFESSEINQDNFQKFLKPLSIVLNEAKDRCIDICLETILDGNGLLNLFEYFDDDNLSVVFDTGNRVAHNHNLYDDILKLGTHVSHVHIKDKNILDQNVLLGTGLVNFSEIFDALNKIDYKGPYVFETTRGSDPILTAKFNISVIEFFKKNSDLNG